MSRLLILIDRAGDDTDWKGAVVWRIIRSLAEAQHEVMVACSAKFDEPPVTHSRLSVIRPVNSWRLDQMPKLAKVLLQFQPQVVQTFALQDRGLWPKLSVWPYFSAMCSVVPGIKSVSTIFDGEDASAMLENWHRQASSITMFSQSLAEEMSGPLGRLAEVLPLDLGQLPSSPEASDVALVPAAVSEWEYPEQNLIHLRDLLQRFPAIQAKIIGGWGSWSASQKREGWKILENVAARVQMTEPLEFFPFAKELACAREVWLEPVRRTSWRFQISSHLAHQSGKKILLGSPSRFHLPPGSTANSLSRIYTK